MHLTAALQQAAKGKRPTIIEMRADAPYVARRCARADIPHPRPSPRAKARGDSTGAGLEMLDARARPFGQRGVGESALRAPP